ncbi:hypothetical protein ACFLS8_00390 [Chloroflexota bacterium]
MKKDKIQLIVIAAIAFIASVFVLTDYFLEVNSPYQVFRCDTGASHYTFQFSTSYDFSYFDVADDGDSTFTYIDLWKEQEEGSGMYTLISVSVFPPDADTPDAGTAIRKALAQGESLPDFRLISQSEIIVGRTTAHEIVFVHSFTIGYTGIDQGYQSAYSRITRDVYLEEGGFIWKLTFRVTESAYEATRADFEHILDTFRILG